jgi:hypothetical protein
VTTDEDQAKSITLTATDADDDDLTFTVLTDPTDGRWARRARPTARRP